MEEFQPKRRLGQNFLVDENVARKIIRHLAPKPEDLLLEIGPGFGVLTKYVLPVACSVVAVEIDRSLVAELRRRFADAANLTIVHQDFRKLSLEDHGSPDHPLRVFGNIPYHITSPVLFKVLASRDVVSDMHLTIQREVAERIVGRPRSKDYGILAVLCQTYSHPKIEFAISRNVFYPKPDVDSALVHLDFRDAPHGDRVEDHEFYLRVVKTAFSKRRKMLRNTLRELAENIESLPGVDLEKRAEELTIDEFISLANTIARRIRS